MYAFLRTGLVLFWASWEVEVQKLLPLRLLHVCMSFAEESTAGRNKGQGPGHEAVRSPALTAHSAKFKALQGLAVSLDHPVMLILFAAICMHCSLLALCLTLPSPLRYEGKAHILS